MKLADSNPAWIATQATVTTCRYQFARMNTLTLGIATTKKFRISFEYFVNGRLYSGDFQSAVSIPQDERFSLRYNPTHPEENDRSSDSGPSTPSTMLGFGIAGSIVLSILWLVLVRGCN